VGPLPVRRGGPAILVGGHADAALARVVRLGDGFLAGATSGPAHAIAALDRLRHLSDELALAPVTRAVANVFVQPGRSADEAIRAAVAIFTQRHGGAPPWDPSAVVVAGPEDGIVERLTDMHLRGFSGLNLVPVDMTLEGVSAVAAVASQLSSLRSAS
jgi:alkanesulfonate monooxygenase SsuD/methylene tetrahydromethanopterin reductase-like flavin-dependent oxidoreductase (luciferase family)